MKLSPVHGRVSRGSYVRPGVQTAQTGEGSIAAAAEAGARAKEKGGENPALRSKKLKSGAYAALSLSADDLPVRASRVIS
jgi:hypothetical protein